jgi:hypothetical protein
VAEGDVEADVGDSLGADDEEGETGPEFGGRPLGRRQHDEPADERIREPCAHDRDRQRGPDPRGARVGFLAVQGPTVPPGCIEVSLLSTIIDILRTFDMRRPE